MRLRLDAAGEIQLGDPVVGLLTGGGRGHESAGLDTLQPRHLGREGKVDAEIVPVKGVRVVGACVQDYELDRHVMKRYAHGQPRACKCA